MVCAPDDLFGGDGEKRARFDRRIIRNDHPVAPRHLADARDRPTRGRTAHLFVHSVARKGHQFVKKAVFIYQLGDALTRRQPFLAVLTLDGLFAATF